MRQRLVEYLLVTAFLALAAAGAVALFGDELRGALGLRPAGGSSLDAGPAPRDGRSGWPAPTATQAAPADR